MKRGHAERFMVGAIAVRDGSWRAIFQVHTPCDGAQHKRCTVVDEWVSPPCSDAAAATELLLTAAGDSPLKGWTSCPGGAEA